MQLKYLKSGTLLDWAAGILVPSALHKAILDRSTVHWLQTFCNLHVVVTHTLILSKHYKHLQLVTRFQVVRYYRNNSTRIYIFFWTPREVKTMSILNVFSTIKRGSMIYSWGLTRKVGGVTGTIPPTRAATLPSMITRCHWVLRDGRRGSREGRRTGGEGIR